MASIFKQQYTTKDRQGRSVKKKSQHWYIDYKTSDGTRKRVKGFKDKAATSQLAAKLEREVELVKVGIVDKYAEHRKRLLLDHLRDFKDYLLHKGDTLQHASLTHNRAEAVIKACKFVYFSDISPSRILKYLAERRHLGLSIKSSNYYLQSIKHFLNWLVNDRRAAENPIAHLKGLNSKTDVRRIRRALTLEELNTLIETTAQGAKHHNLTGRERAMLYLLAIYTGFRAGELASLTWASFDLNGDYPTVTVSAAYSKRRREDIQPLRQDLAELFSQWQCELDAPSDAIVFGKFNDKKRRCNDPDRLTSSRYRI